jgi:hypothetical protein
LPNIKNNPNFDGNQAMTKRSEKSLAHRLELIRYGRGCLKRKRGEKPFSESWAEYKKQERALEQRFQRLGFGSITGTPQRVK